MDVMDEGGATREPTGSGAALGGSPDGPGSGGATAADSVDAAVSRMTPEREIDDLKFLIGTACSRLINLLMDPQADPAALGAEAAFVSARAGRLSDLLAQQALLRPETAGS
jgi:hypothetical protein